MQKSRLYRYTSQTFLCSSRTTNRANRIATRDPHSSAHRFRRTRNAPFLRSLPLRGHSTCLPQHFDRRSCRCDGNFFVFCPSTPSCLRPQLIPSTTNPRCSHRFQHLRQPTPCHQTPTHPKIQLSCSPASRQLQIAPFTPTVHMPSMPLPYPAQSFSCITFHHSTCSRPA